MAKNVFTTTISLPKPMAQRLLRMSKKEGRSTSEMIRETLREYERTHYQSKTSWTSLRKQLLKVSQSGGETDLAALIAKERQR